MTADLDGGARRYRELVLFELSDEFRMGFFLSYFRNFAVPHIAKTLLQYGEIVRDPIKRSYDTAIVIYELIADGVDGPRGEAMVSLLRRAHKGVPGSDDDFLYVLLTLLIVPLDYIDRFGRRSLRREEKEAAFRFYMHLGQRMGLTIELEAYDEAEKFFRQYERANIAASLEGQRLFDLTVGLYQERLPRAMHRLARRILSALFADDQLNMALGLSPAIPALMKVLRVSLRLKAKCKFRPRTATFVPGRSGSKVYPSGYKLQDLGPRGG
jgi:hypothetical protein